MKPDQNSLANATENDLNTDIKDTGYGWRKSVHADWLVRNKEIIAGLSGWGVEVENFFQVIALNDPDKVIRICAVSPHGYIESEHFVGFYESYQIAQLLMYLSDQGGNNLMFDPVPWKNGKRLVESSFGFRTVTDGHPFDHYPSPSIFWSIGRNAFQSMTVLPGEWDARQMNSLFGAVNGDCVHVPKESRFPLMFVPGSEVLTLDQPDFSSEVLFDEVTEDCGEGKEWRWSQY